MMNRSKNAQQYNGQVTERFTKIAICQEQGLCFVNSDKLLVGTLLNAFSLGTESELFWQIIYYSNQASV